MKEENKNNKNFALRLPADMMEQIEKWAADEFRSTNGQILWMLEQMLRKNGRAKAPK